MTVGAARLGLSKPPVEVHNKPVQEAPGSLQPKRQLPSRLSKCHRATIRRQETVPGAELLQPCQGICKPMRLLMRSPLNNTELTPITHASGLVLPVSCGEGRGDQGHCPSPHPTPDGQYPFASWPANNVERMVHAMSWQTAPLLSTTKPQMETR